MNLTKSNQAYFKQEKVSSQPTALKIKSMLIVEIHWVLYSLLTAIVK
jgi:hypothetical protein